MDDDAGDWFADAVEETPPEPAPAATAEANADASAAADGEKSAAEGAKEEEQEAPQEYIDPDKLLLFKHWIRPKFLQYNYLYKYRHNYYDDVIDYLDKRQKGLSRDVPRAQTWAERILRSGNSKGAREEYYRRAADDTKLVSNSHFSGAFYHYHSRQYVNRHYSSVLF